MAACSTSGRPAIQNTLLLSPLEMIVRSQVMPFFQLIIHHQNLSKDHQYAMFLNEFHQIILEGSQDHFRILHYEETERKCIISRSYMTHSPLDIADEINYLIFKCLCFT